MAINFIIHHVAISVIDLDRSEQFYSKFGFTRIDSWRSASSTHSIRHLKLDKTILELFCFDSFEKLPSFSESLSTDLPRIGVKHFALAVPSIDDAAALVSSLGIELATPINKGRLNYFFVRDPDGILLEFIEDSRNLVQA